MFTKHCFMIIMVDKQDNRQDLWPDCAILHQAQQHITCGSGHNSRLTFVAFWYHEGSKDTNGVGPRVCVFSYITLNTAATADEGTTAGEQKAFSLQTSSKKF